MARGTQILVIDDTDAVRASLMALLRAGGFQCTGAENGRAGLAALERGLPDLVLCDLRMPVLDGLGFLEAVRDRHPNLPVIVMSGAGLLDDAVGALKQGAWDYLTKPIFEVEVLRHAIEKAVERARLLDENRRHRVQLEAMNRELRTTLGMLAEDEDAGRQLQFRMLPRNHQRFGDFEFSLDLVPSAYLSGDFIDAFAIDATRWAFYLADVSGHGVSSALVTVLLRGQVQRQREAFVQRGDPLVLQPAALLALLNDVIVGEPLEKHLTMFYGVIDLGTSTLCWANAGHFPAPLLFDGHAAVELAQPGLPLGLLPGARYEARAQALGPEVVLSAFSDGLLEALAPLPVEEKLALLRRTFSRLEVTVEGARQALHVDERRPLPDDVALLLIKRGGHHAGPGDGPLRAP